MASYKFALARSLLDLAGRPDDLIRLDELAVPFSRHLCEHVASNPRQGTSSSSKFLDACRAANAGELDEDELINATVKLGFNNVIDAFHRLGPSDLATRFFIDERRLNNGIRISDHLRNLTLDQAAEDLCDETDARWRLVEAAWELGVSIPLIKHNAVDASFVVLKQNRRARVASARASLNGYSGRANNS